MTKSPTGKRYLKHVDPAAFPSRRAHDTFWRGVGWAVFYRDLELGKKFTTAIHAENLTRCLALAKDFRAKIKMKKTGQYVELAVTFA